MKKNKKRANQYLLVAGAAAASLAPGCDNTQKQWENSPGTNGFVNLDAVKKAFIEHPKVEDFEERVNEIFEGDNLIIFKAKEIKGGFTYNALEDLNRDKEASSDDESLFILTLVNGRATLQGTGVNKYYKETWAYEPVKEDQPPSNRHYHHTHFHYWYWGRSWRGYYTPRQSYDRINDHRNGYRQSSAFVSQVNNNVNYENNMAKRYGAGFKKSVGAVSNTRKSYINNTKKSGNVNNLVKNSKSASVRSSSSAKSSFSSSRSGSGGFRGSSGFGV